MMGTVGNSSYFKQSQRFKVDYADATYTQYESERTGLRAVVVDRKGPMVCCIGQSYFLDIKLAIGLRILRGSYRNS